MTQTVTDADGTVHSFPDDATPDEMQAALGGAKVGAGAYLGSRAIAGVANAAQSMGEAANIEMGNQGDNALKPGEMAARANKKVIGTEQPQPQSDWLKIPGAAVESLTSAGPAAVLTAPLALATAGAGAGSEAAGQGAAALNLPWWAQMAARFGGGLVGGVGGGATPAAARAVPSWLRPMNPDVVASASRATPGATVTPSVVRKAVNYAGDTLAPEIKYGGVTPQQITTGINAFPDKPSMLADQSGALQGLTEQLTHKMGPGKFIIEPALKARDAGAGDRIVQDISDTISNGGSAYTTEKALTAQQRANAAPLFEKAMAVGPVHSDRLQQFLDDPIMQSGLQDGVTTQRLQAVADGKPFDPNAYTLTYDADGNLKFMGTPNMQTLQAGKIGLDNQINKYRDAFGNLNLDQRGRALVAFTRKFNDELRTLNPDYAAANDSWAGEAASKDALNLGQQFRTMRPEQIADKLADMTPSEKQFFLQGAADSLITGVNKTAATGNEARALLGNAKIRDQLRPLFSSDEAYEGAMGRLAEENRQWQTTNQALANSRTAFRLSGTPVQSAKPPVIPHAIGAAVAAHTGEPMVAMSEGTKALANVGRRLFGGRSGISPDVEAATAHMLTETDPVRRAAIAQAIIQRATRKPFTFGVPAPAMLGSPGNQALLRQLYAPNQPGTQ